MLHEGGAHVGAARENMEQSREKAGLFEDRREEEPATDGGARVGLGDC